MASNSNSESSHTRLNLSDYDQLELEDSEDEGSLLLQDDTDSSCPPSERFDDLSFTESLSLLIENGRTYTQAEKSTYMLPNDSKENARLETQYLIITALMRGKVYLAPLKRDPKHAPRRILDVGCGTGVWCLDMAQIFENAQIVGMDISQASRRFSRPENVTFKVGNMHTEPWGGPYDFIHTRFMLGTAPNFRSVIQQAYENLEPGGWFESQELWPKSGCDDHTMPADFLLKEWEQLQDEVAMKGQNNAPVRIADKLRRWCREVGFVDIHQEIFKIPINRWPKDARLHLLGKLWCNQLCDGMSAFTMKYFTSAPMNWSTIEVEIYLAKVRNAIKDQNVHAYHRIFVVWARKPTLAETAAKEAANSGSSGKKPVANSSL